MKKTEKSGRWTEGGRWHRPEMDEKDGRAGREDGRAVPKYDLGAIDKERNSGREAEAVTRAKMRENGTKIALLFAYLQYL
ncbi:MAG: hypothetical protein IJ047_03450 [Paludibacteraceae bacterium]|nr:hypothetical protein [Paludibacteraceae bacterium]